MTGIPVYPDDWATEQRQQKSMLRSALTAARTRVAYARVAAAELVVGAITGKRILIRPDGDPRLEFYASDNVTDPSRIVSFVVDTGAGTESQNALWISDRTNDDQAQTILAMWPGFATFARIFMPSGGGFTRAGGIVEISDTAARIGFNDEDASTYNAMTFNSDGVTAHAGRWYNNVDSGANSGLFTGSVAASATAVTISYGTTALTARVPIITSDDTQAIGSIAAHQVNTVVTSGFDAEKNTFQGASWTVNFWAFRT